MHTHVNNVTANTTARTVSVELASGTVMVVPYGSKKLGPKNGIPVKIGGTPSLEDLLKQIGSSIGAKLKSNDKNNPFVEAAYGLTKFGKRIGGIGRYYGANKLGPKSVGLAFELTSEDATEAYVKKQFRSFYKGNMGAASFPFNIRGVSNDGVMTISVSAKGASGKIFPMYAPRLFTKSEVKAGQALMAKRLQERQDLLAGSRKEMNQVSKKSWPSSQKDANNVLAYLFDKAHGGSARAVASCMTKAAKYLRDRLTEIRVKGGKTAFTCYPEDGDLFVGITIPIMGGMAGIKAAKASFKNYGEMGIGKTGRGAMALYIETSVESPSRIDPDDLDGFCYDVENMAKKASAK